MGTVSMAHTVIDRHCVDPQCIEVEAGNGYLPLLHLVGDVEVQAFHGGRHSVVGSVNLSLPLLH